MTAGRYAFLRSRAWGKAFALAVTVSLACAALGWWQWNRHSDRLAAVERVDANYDAPAVPVGQLVQPDGFDAADAWRPVVATGAYAEGGTVLLRNRPVSGNPALHVLDPLVVDLPGTGLAVLVVDRGWVPAGSENDPAAVPGPPDGEVTVVVRLRPAEQPAARGAPSGQAYTIDPAQVLGQSAVDDAVRRLPLLPAYGVVEMERADGGGAPGGAPLPVPRPDTDLGTHLSYTFQWWVFSVGAFVGLAVLIRREARAREAAEAPTSATTPAPRRPRPARRRPTAEEEEDALLDAEWRRAGR